MMGVQPQEPDCSEFVEVDPTGRYGRYDEILGKGASKTVYKAFDEYEGIEVAWNQVKLYDFLQSPEDLERLYCEIHLLKTLKHKNIMKFYASWVDTTKRNINFVTEMFTSGTLRQYREKHKRVNIRAVKHWCRQILRGLLYLHSHDPPVIHRDLKCDNIFVNGNQGEVKIGDLGLAAILRKSHAAHCVGTPEFMAPEVYQEEYDELVDVYSFGMCILEMVTFEYPYSECTHPAQIYKKVISGTKPEALYKVRDPEVRQFVEKCLANAPCRLSAMELLKDPFLQIDERGSGYREGGGSGYREGDAYDMGHIHYSRNGSLITSGFSDDYQHEPEIENGWNYGTANIETHGIYRFNSHEDEPFASVDITIKGRRKEDGGVFLRLRITDRDGRVRNIYFPFDVETDTALSVAAEMVTELDITDYEVTRIAEMIDGEVSSLVPGWNPGLGIEALGNPTTTWCQRCASNVSSCGSLLDYLSLKSPGCSNLQSSHCPHLECASTHGRFEEITYQAEGSEPCAMLSTRQSDPLESCSQTSEGSHCDEEGSQLVSLATVERPVNDHVETGTRNSLGELYSSSSQQHCSERPESGNHHPLSCLTDNYENGIRQELRWIKAKYKKELRNNRNQQLGGLRRVLHSSPDFSNSECMPENGISNSLDLAPLQTPDDSLMKSFHLGTHFSFPIPHVDTSTVPTNKCPPFNTSARNCSSSRPNTESRRAGQYEVNPESSPQSMFTASSFYAAPHQPLARTKSLLVDAVDV